MASQEIYAIAANFNNVLVFLQAIVVKVPRIAAAPLSLCADKHAWYWFRHWSYHHLSLFSTPLDATPQGHSGITGVLNNVAMRLQNEESLHLIITAKREADK